MTNWRHGFHFFGRNDIEAWTHDSSRLLRCRTQQLPHDMEPSDSLAIGYIPFSEGASSAACRGSPLHLRIAGPSPRVPLLQHAVEAPCTCDWLALLRGCPSCSTLWKPLVLAARACLCECHQQVAAAAMQGDCLFG